MLFVFDSDLLWPRSLSHAKNIFVIYCYIYIIYNIYISYIYYNTLDEHLWRNLLAATRQLSIMWWHDNKQKLMRRRITKDIKLCFFQGQYILAAAFTNTDHTNIRIISNIFIIQHAKFAENQWVVVKHDFGSHLKDASSTLSFKQMLTNNK